MPDTEARDPWGSRFHVPSSRLEKRKLAVPTWNLEPGTLNLGDGRGAFRTERSVTVRTRGLYGSEDAGISSEKTGENPVRRKPKGS
jgi:hypothetical protein